MASYGGFNYSENPLLTVSRTVSKISPSKGPKRSLQIFTKGVREKLNTNPIVDFRTDSHFQDVIQSCNDIKEVYLAVDQGVQSLMETLKKMELSNAKAISTISERVKYLNDTSHQIIQEGNRNWELLTKLESTADFSSGASYIDEIEDTFDDIESDVKAVRCALQQYEDGKSLIAKDFIKKKIWLKSIAEVIKGGTDEKSPVNITMDELRVLCDCLSKEVHERKIFVVVKTKEGKQKAAPVDILSKNQIRVSYLKEMDLPPKSFFIEFNSLTHTSLRAFLDLSYEETFLSRIVISLQKKGFLPFCFLHMCAGDLGPCYASNGHFEVSSTGNIVIRQSHELAREKANQSKFFWVDLQKEMKRGIYNNKQYKGGNVRCEALKNDTTGGIAGLIFKIITGTTMLHESTMPSSLPWVGDVKEGLDELKEGISRYPNIERGDVTASGLEITF